MRQRYLVLALLAVLACRKKEQPAPVAEAPDTTMIVGGAFKTPESVLYDAQLDAYLVSNINGTPATKDDNGFISRVGTDGHVIEANWIDGASDSVMLNAPKGMAIRGDTLFVADIDVVRLFNRATGAPVGAWRVPGATFLNDVSVGPDGTVYVTDTGLKPDFTSSGTDAIWRFDARGRATKVAGGRSLGGPNGVTADSAGLVVVTFVSGEVYRLNAAGRRTNLPKPAKGQLDGVVLLPGGALLVSSWADSSVSRLNPADTAWTKVVTGVQSPADIGYDTRRGRLLIPVFQADRIEIRPLR